MWAGRKLACFSILTSRSAWEKFNGRTRMMKGLFNYETAYRTYTRKLLEDCKSLLSRLKCS